jgi:hypothetical protein
VAVGEAVRMFESLGLGTVRAIADVATIDVESRTGMKFTGSLRDTAIADQLRPGVVLLVAFDPAAREHLSLADDVSAVRASL